MAKKKVNTDSLKNYGKTNTVSEPQKEQTSINDSSKKNKKVITLDITDEEDYLNLMAKHEGIPRTKYIRNLIKADREQNQRKYEALKMLRDLDNK